MLTPPQQLAPQQKAPAPKRTPESGKVGRKTAIDANTLAQIRALRDNGVTWVEIEKIHQYDTRTMRSALNKLGAYADQK